MSDDIRITIALICGAVIFAWLFFFVFLKGKTKGNQLMAKARQSGCITTGRVVKNDYRRFTGPEGRYRSEIVTYEYSILWTEKDLRRKSHILTQELLLIILIR